MWVSGAHERLELCCLFAKGFKDFEDGNPRFRRTRNGGSRATTKLGVSAETSR
jgi:hypothetical protein